MILAVDFDDTIHDRSHIAPGRRMGTPMPGAISALNRLVAEGHVIIIFTGRDVQHPAAYKAVEDWLNFFHVPFSGITNIKSPKYDLFIDNRAIHFDSWPQTMAKLNTLNSEAALNNYIDEQYKTR